MHLLIHLIDQYGYIVLFFSLMLELIIVPVPNEILMSYVGFLAYQGKVHFALAILFGGLGGIVGVTISYWIGFKLGAPFFYKYGSKFHLGPEKIERISRWNQKYGRRLLLFSFFIPGVRHVTSLFSGITRLPFRSFVVFAYIGVFLWVGTFIFLGKIFGPKWEQFHQEAKLYMIIGCIVIGLVYAIYLYIKVNIRKIRENLILLFEAMFKRFHSFLGMKLLIFGMAIVFITMFSLMVGMIQDFIENEFGQFNTITKAVVSYIVDPRWKQPIDSMYSLLSRNSLLFVGFLTIIWIFFKGKNKWLEFQYYVICILGALILSKGLHILFSYIAAANMFSQSFPSELSFLWVVLYIFFLYIVLRHSQRKMGNVLIVVLEMLIFALISVSSIYLGSENPSDLVAGYTFGGVWVSLIILMIEISRLLNMIKASKRGHLEKTE
ncbi:VTT domain-containing protein [Bacillus smithii]|uniref:VTT domain-containing protein n=1 Tax=Bacillus smithii TaxID=1479 RepID=UPI0022E0EF70|nr:VTT domain-containing protein [Bacillus smithii]